ncbi:MAG: PRC-barrel domain-containing protein, partial [Clostridia bacterium]|nr:PRC-barrel domain-containing protein [Clostridia bacterium]
MNDVRRKAMYLSELLQKPILSLYEGEILGNITNVYFDKTRKKIKSFEIMNDEEINYHLYPKFIYT